MYSTHNERKSVVAERFIRTLKEQNLQICDFSIKNMHIDELADRVNEYNNVHYWTIKMKPVDVNSSTYIEFGTENNEKILIWN